MRIGNIDAVLMHHINTIDSDNTYTEHTRVLVENKQQTKQTKRESGKKPKKTATNKQVEMANTGTN